MTNSRWIVEEQRDYTTENSSCTDCVIIGHLWSKTLNTFKNKIKTLNSCNKLGKLLIESDWRNMKQ